MCREEKEVCFHCGKNVDRDEIGLTKKLINRGTTRYYCIRCLADAFDVTEENLRDKIGYYKSIGCTLFQKE